MTITIVGLGPGDPELLTRRAWRVLEEAPEVWFRTVQHPGVEALPIKYRHSFDNWYEQAEDFNTLYLRIADEVVKLGTRPEGVVYAVPGHPLVGELTVTLILKDAADKGVKVALVDGLGFIEPTLTALGLDALDGLQIYDAVDVSRMHHPPLNPDTPTLLAQVYSEAVASNTKLTLVNQYPEDHEVVLVHGAGTSTPVLERIPLYEMDHSDRISHLTSLYIPPLKRKGSFEYFQEIVAHLRAPEGCPWDRKQTHESLRAYLLEETYEVLEALDAGDYDEMYKEMGDLLLQIVLHTQIATEAGEFQMVDLIAHVCEKMIRRHPHVWGDVEVNGDAEKVLDNWVQIKKREKSVKGEEEAPASALDGVPNALPALAYASSISSRAARVGFEWDKVEDVVAKLHEEINELFTTRDPKHRAEEFGDVLTVLVNLARWWEIDPEAVMREATQKFVRRFRGIEALARDQGKRLEEMTLAEMDVLWDQVKAGEKKG